MVKLPGISNVLCSYLAEKKSFHYFLGTLPERIVALRPFGIPPRDGWNSVSNMFSAGWPDPDSLLQIPAEGCILPCSIRFAEEGFHAQAFKIRLNRQAAELRGWRQNINEYSQYERLLPPAVSFLFFI